MKKLISVLISFVMLFSVLPVVAETATEYEDTKAADVLLAVEAIDSVRNFDTAVTRGQFAAYVANIVFNNSLEFVKEEFDDVPQTHSYYREISLMSDYGAMNGRESRIFAPDDNITFEEAVKVLVYVLGYSGIAEAKGGFPFGYISVAKDLNIINGSYSSNNLTNGDVYNLLYNCLEISHMIPTSVDESNVNLEVSDISFLSLLGFKHVEDVVISANGFTNLYGDELSSMGFFVADGIRYKDITGKAFDLIGCEVEIYYNDEISSKPATYVELSDYNKIVEVSADRVVSLDASGMSYEEDNKIKNIKFSVYTDCIYNYALTDFADLTKEDLTDASIKYVKSGDNDIVYVYKFVDYYVKHINYDENKIIDKLTNQTIDFDDFDSFFIPLEGEESAGFEDINANQLINIAKPKTGNTMVVVRSTETVGGKIDQVGNNGFYIGNRFIEITSALKNSEFAPVLGDMGTFFLNPNGQGAMFLKTKSRNYKYGYVIEGQISTGLSSSLKLKILSENGKIVDAESGEKCIVDGVKCSIGDSRFSSLYVNWLSDDHNAQSKIQPQLIRYNIDGDGKLTMIDTEYTDEKDDPEGLVSKNGLLKELNGRPGYDTFKNTIAVGTDGIQFWVPNDLSITDEKNFKVVTGGVTSAAPDVKAYDENDVNYSPAVVCYQAAGAGVATEGDLFLVGEVTKCLVEEDEAYKVKGLYSGIEKECYVKSETMKDYITGGKTAFEPGDILTCNINDSNYITAFTMRYNIKDRYNYESGLPYNMNWLTETYYMTAVVRSVDDVFFRLSYGWKDELSDDFVYSAASVVTQQSWASIYVFDEAADSYRLGSLADLKPYNEFGNEASRVFVWFDWGQCACIVVLNLDQ